METMHGWYSKQQQDSYDLYYCNRSRGKTPHRYIYYLDKNDNIVQVTEVTREPTYTSKYTDAVYIGELKQFHSNTPTPIDISSPEAP